MQKNIFALLALLTFAGVAKAQFTTGSNNSTSNMLRVTGYEAQPPSGTGVELGFETSALNGFLQTYNRSSGAYHNLSFYGKDIQLYPQGGGRIITHGKFGFGTEPLTYVHTHLATEGDAGSLTSYAFLVSQAASYLAIGGNNNHSMVQSFNSKPLFINKLGNNIILNLDAGNVGIGTANPQAKLSVNGNIQARRVKVTVNSQDWPDFVFEPSFQPMPLPQLEQFIRKYKHLPEIPSAKEVGENGIDLGETQARLLKKIEELTLYIIEQQQQIREQGERIKKLEAVRQ